MASGLELMMKAMGVNPDALKEQANAVQATVKDFKAQLNRIETKLDRILENEQSESDRGDEIDREKSN